MERMLLSWFLTLALAMAGLSMFGVGPASAASPLWTFPLAEEASTQMTIAPSGAILDEECTNISPDGTELWTLPPHQPVVQQCYEAITDSVGNLYVFRATTRGEDAVESFNASGHFRWSTTTGTNGPLNVAPVFGTNGDVYFGSTDGGATNLLGLDEGTGAITLERGFSSVDRVRGLSAYSGGLVVFAGISYTYLGYDGSTLHEYDISAFSGRAADSSTGGAGGDVFAGGYSGSCGIDAHASVEKFTPTGLAWTWTAPDVAEGCSGTSMAATPDGGVILGRDEGRAATYTSIGPDGHERWSAELTGASSRSRVGGFLPITVDVNGTVALPADTEYVCASPSGFCEEAIVKYLSTTTGATVFPELLLGGPSPEGGFGIENDAAFTGRTYLIGNFYETEVYTEGEPVIVAFDTPGLAKPYPLFLQEALTASGPPAPSPPALTVTPSSDPPSLTVTVADGGGGGVAGAPDPGSNPCTKTLGDFVNRLLAGAECQWAKNKTLVQCAVGVSGWLFLPLKILQGAKLASGLLDTSKLAKPLQPVAKLYNDLSLAKYTKNAPPGFRTPRETKDTLDKVKDAEQLVALLPDLRSALSAHDFSEVALDISKIGGFESCVKALANAMSR